MTARTCHTCKRPLVWNKGARWWVYQEAAYMVPGDGPDAAWTLDGDRITGRILPGMPPAGSPWKVVHLRDNCAAIPAAEKGATP